MSLASATSVSWLAAWLSNCRDTPRPENIDEPPRPLAWLAEPPGTIAVNPRVSTG